MQATEARLSIQSRLDMITPRIRALARRYEELCNTPMISEDDLAQEGLIAAWEGLTGDKWDEEKSSLTTAALWAFMRARVNSAMVDFVRKHGVLSVRRLAKFKQGETVAQVQKLTPAIEKSSAVACEDEQSEAMLSDDLVAIIKRLSPDIEQRNLEILVERFAGDCTHDEIGERHAITPRGIGKIISKQIETIKRNAESIGMTAN